MSLILILRYKIISLFVKICPKIPIIREVYFFYLHNIIGNMLFRWIEYEAELYRKTIEKEKGL